MNQLARELFAIGIVVSMAMLVVYALSLLLESIFGWDPLIVACVIVGVVLFAIPALACIDNARPKKREISMRYEPSPKTEAD